MTNGHTTSRLKRLALAGAFAALLAVGAVSAGVAGDPSQWGAIADHLTALNFTKIEYQALNFAKIEF